MFGLGKKKEPKRWGGKYAIRKITRNNGATTYNAVARSDLLYYWSFWQYLASFPTCEEAEEWIENAWGTDTAKIEFITHCEECE